MLLFILAADLAPQPFLPEEEQRYLDLRQENLTLKKDVRFWLDNITRSFLNVRRQLRIRIRATTRQRKRYPRLLQRVIQRLEQQNELFRRFAAVENFPTIGQWADGYNKLQETGDALTWRNENLTRENNALQAEIFRLKQRPVATGTEAELRAELARTEAALEQANRERAGIEETLRETQSRAYDPILGFAQTLDKFQTDRGLDVSADLEFFALQLKGLRPNPANQTVTLDRTYNPEANNIFQDFDIRQ